MLTKEQILSAMDRASKITPVPEWGGDVCLSVIGGADRDELTSTFSEGVPVSTFYARILSYALVDALGRRMFNADDVAALAQKNPDTVVRLGLEALRMNGLAAASIEDAEKNSDASPNASSGSDSLAS
ncbi:hypothetical protein [Burkholderia sp. USMB20]|uniref:hypothetical protein n=1 Tax=Burkholderia sp. USMB20 TaxID=1571773 RepID=UPI0005CE5730|nr:hypothetical protein [Burkholderia sp. USMB20]TGN96124.1 hypothetical protein PL79_018955 [Burkholderia sp. USMB20]